MKVRSCPIFKIFLPQCEIESFCNTGRQKKIDCFSVNGFCSCCNTVFEARGCFYQFPPCPEVRHSLTEDDIQRGSTKTEFVELRRRYIQENGFTFFEMWECEEWRLYKTSNNVKRHIREKFPYTGFFAADQLIDEMKTRKSFRCVHCDIEGTKNLRLTFLDYPPIFKNTLVRKNVIVDLKKTYSEEERTRSQPRKMLISSFTLRNSTLLTPLLLFYVHLRCYVIKIHSIVEYTPMKCLKSFVQSAVDARRQVDKNSKSSVVAETMRLLHDSSNGYQIMDRS